MALPTTRRLVLGGGGLAVLLTSAHAVNDAFTNILPVFLPILQARFGVGEAALAVFVATISVSSNVLQPFMGALSDRWGRRRTAALGLIVGSVLMSFLAVVPSVALLVGLLAVGGLGSALFHPSAASMARAAGRRKGFSMGLFTAGGPLGTAVAPVAVLTVIRVFGARWVPLLSVVGVVLGLALLLFTPRQERAVGASRPKVFDLALFLGPVGLLALSGILRAVAFISFNSATPLWLVNVRGYAPDAPIVGLTLGAFSAASALGVLAAGALETRLGRRSLVLGSMVLALPALFAVLLVPTGTPLYYLVVALAGLLTNAPIPLMVVSAQDLAPHAVATASGLLMGFTWGVAGVLYIPFGALQQAVGLVPAIGLSYLFLIPAAGLAMAVLRRVP